MKKRIYNSKQVEKKEVFIDFNSVPVYREQEGLVLGKPGYGRAFQAIKPGEYPVKNFEQL